ncbi:hypothetical protein HHK36_006750 [Tetracentron sinense]|uniref:Uncharacterized protein n=1 Tax=Tetracentron sinense TaxID=13715 RepID=A0A834ZSA6_TETSI|nr:hypothetical protein HHK36_006750 [Tetracentron sinense]
MSFLELGKPAPQVVAPKQSRHSSVEVPRRSEDKNNNEYYHGDCTSLHKTSVADGAEVRMHYLLGRVTRGFVVKIASRDVRIVVLQRRTRSHVCSSASSAVLNACVFLLALMATSRPAHATTTGRHRKEDPSALKAS